jgi:hypothetical protein
MWNRICAMHSLRADVRRTRHGVARAVLLGALAWGGVAAAWGQDIAPEPASAAASPFAAASAAVDPRAKRIEAAVRKLSIDPLLSGKHKIHTLRWKDSDEPEKNTPRDPSVFAWLAALAGFLNDTSRFLLWGAVAVLVALLLVSARHLVQLRGFRRNAAAASAVSHVRDLDVRPESLPDDVGAAAWALWQAGQVQAALSLLYRGALSRLIHRFRVPITASATEGECLDLARGRLDPVALRYVTQVVRAWEASIYGGRSLSSAMGEALCSGFAQRLDASSAGAVEAAA